MSWLISLPHALLRMAGAVRSACCRTLLNRKQLNGYSRAVQRTRPFIVALEGAGAFPPRGVPRILWLGINDSSGVLSELQSHLEEDCKRVGFACEERPFHPHLTIARIRTPRAARQLAHLHQDLGFEAIEFYITELVVIQSELAAGGSRYTEISRHSFKAVVSE
ncbi:MAG TPA: RNA 2',3'-cyclic phosphodiesterase [Pyrinomonadaceae bacterium]|jgi:2'-5' RNA ligase|nr:RNA 2',3'-cyclic phosphodiesterase [Pyrinomonadaceae bacterium]